MSGFTIRPYAPRDAGAVAEIYVRAVTGLGPRGYSPEQVATWASNARTPEEVTAWAGDGRTVLVAADQHDEPVAFMDVEADGHIDMLFCLPDWTGQGVASALFNRIAELALNRGIRRLYTEASEVAKPVFSRWGFQLLHRNDMEVKGVAVHNYTMEKRL